MPKVNTSVLMVNESCLSVSWEIPSDFPYYDCIQHIQVDLRQQNHYSNSVRWIQSMNAIDT